jgi:hypothetical protein
MMLRSTAVLLEQIESWICHALLSDDYGEFFIERNSRDSSWCVHTPSNQCFAATVLVSLCLSID